MNKHIRETIINQRLSITPLKYIQMSSEISSKLFANEYFLKAKIIAIYLPIKQEVDTQLIIDYARILGKSIVVPKIKDNEMIMVKYQPPFTLSKFGVNEPVIEDIIERDVIDLIVCPVVGFHDHMRLGYGKGYYDRYLQGYLGHTIGLAFSFQEVNFSVHEHDYTLTKVLTNR